MGLGLRIEEWLHRRNDWVAGIIVGILTSSPILIILIVLLVIFL